MSQKRKTSHRAACRQANSHARILFLTLVLACSSGALLAGQSAEAYYWGSFRNLGGNFLYSLPYLGLNLAGVGGPYNANPLYSTSAFLRRSSLGAYQYPLTMSQPLYTTPYLDPEPIYSPRQRSRPIKSGQLGVDEMTYANWQPSTAGQNSAFGFYPSNVDLNPPMNSQAPSYPPLAPTVVKKGHDANFNAPQSNYANTETKRFDPGHQPLAASFVDHLNNKFGGDIEKALFDPPTRALARSLGLVDGDSLFTAELSESRKAIIQQILQENNLEPASKLETIKIMLSAGANRAKQ